MGCLGCFGANRCAMGEKGCRDIMGALRCLGVKEVFGVVKGCRRDNGVFGA